MMSNNTFVYKEFTIRRLTAIVTFQLGFPLKKKVLSVFPDVSYSRRMQESLSIEAACQCVCVVFLYHSRADHCSYIAN